MSILLTIWAFITANPGIISTGAVTLFELILRRKPTEKDWSIINFIKRLIDALIANKSKSGELF